MRTNMDPLTPTTSTLTPAISHIAETAANLSASLVDKRPNAPKIITPGSEGSNPDSSEKAAQSLEKRKNERQTVRWALDTPKRLRELISEDKSEEAAEEWTEVKALLEKWEGAEGVSALKKECEDVIKSAESDTDD